MYKNVIDVDLVETRSLTDSQLKATLIVRRRAYMCPSICVYICKQLRCWMSVRSQKLIDLGVRVQYMEPRESARRVD